MNFLFEMERDIKKHFLQLLNKKQKDDFFSGISDEDETLSNMSEIDMYQEILNIQGLTLEEAIFQRLHYNLDIYLEVFIDEVGNTTPKKVAIGKLLPQGFSGIILELNTDGYYKFNYIGDNSIIEDTDAYRLDEKLKQYIGVENFNNIFILMQDILMYDDTLGTYVSVNKEFDEQFSDKVIYLEYNNKLIYINSTLSETDIEIVD